MNIKASIAGAALCLIVMAGVLAAQSDTVLLNLDETLTKE